MKSYDINLLPKKKHKVADKLLHFVLYYFRYIIVITQIVVIGVFFFRFRVDQQVIDMKESFKQKQQILAVTVPIVEEAKVIERKIDQVEEVIDSQDLYLNRMNFLLNSIPEEISLQRLEMLDHQISLSGEARDVFAVRALHKKISLTEGFESAEIKSIENNFDQSFEFTIIIPLDGNPA